MVRDARSPHLQNAFGLGSLCRFRKGPWVLWLPSPTSPRRQFARSSRRSCVKETSDQLTRREEIERATGFGDVQEAQRNVGDGCDRVSRLQRGILGTSGDALARETGVHNQRRVLCAFFVALCARLSDRVLRDYQACLYIWLYEIENRVIEGVGAWHVRPVIDKANLNGGENGRRCPQLRSSKQYHACYTITTLRDTLDWTNTRIHNEAGRQ